MNKKRNLAIFAVGLGLLASVAIAGPANASVTCTALGASNGNASATCTGTGYVQLNVTCNAIWPFPVWTDFGARTYVGGGLTIINAYRYCAASVTPYLVFG